MEKERTAALPESERQAKPGRNAAQTKERILRNAERLFAMHPYDNVTLREIAALSEINVALIGRYYGSKKELFCAVLDRLESRRTPLRSEDILGDLADRMVHSLKDWHEDDNQLSVLNILMLSSQSREAMPVIQERVKLFFTDMAKVEGVSAVPAGFMLASCSLGILMLRRMLPGDYSLPASSADIRKALQLLEQALENEGQD